MEFTIVDAGFTVLLVLNLIATIHHHMSTKNRPPGPPAVHSGTGSTLSDGFDRSVSEPVF